MAGFQDVIVDRWDDPEWIARRRVPVTRLKTIKTYHDGNETKGTLLKLALGAELAGVALLAFALARLVQG